MKYKLRESGQACGCGEPGQACGCGGCLITHLILVGRDPIPQSATGKPAFHLALVEWEVLEVHLQCDESLEFHPHGKKPSLMILHTHILPGRCRGDKVVVISLWERKPCHSMSTLPARAPHQGARDSCRCVARLHSWRESCLVSSSLASINSR